MEEKTFSPRRTSESLSNRYQFAEWFSTLWFFFPLWKPQSNFHNEIRILFPSHFDAMNQIKLRNFRRTSISHWLIFIPAKAVVIVLWWLSLDLLFRDCSVVVATHLLLENEIHVLILWKPLICFLSLPLLKCSFFAVFAVLNLLILYSDKVFALLLFFGSVPFVFGLHAKALE